MHQDQFVEQLLDVEDSQSLIMMDSFYALKLARQPCAEDSQLASKKCTRKNRACLPHIAVDRSVGSCQKHSLTKQSRLRLAAPASNESLENMREVCLQTRKTAAHCPVQPEPVLSPRMPVPKSAAYRSLLEASVHPSWKQSPASTARMPGNMNRAFVESQPTSSELTPNEIILKRFGKRSNQLAEPLERRGVLASHSLGALQSYFEQVSQRGASTQADCLLVSSRLFEGSSDGLRSPKRVKTKPLRLHNPELNRLLKGISYVPVHRSLRTAQRPQPVFSICPQRTGQGTILTRYSKKESCRSPEQKTTRQDSFYITSSISHHKAAKLAPSLQAPRAANSFRLSASVAKSSKQLLGKSVQKPRQPALLG